MKPLLIFLLLLCLLPVRAEEPAAVPARVEVAVLYVIDGDSLVVRSVKGGPLIRVRLWGIDSPEMNQEYGPEAKAMLEKMLTPHKTITLLPHNKDRWKRTVADVEAGGVAVSLEMVRRGGAWHYRKYRKSDVFMAAQKTAEKEKAGLWSRVRPVPPWAWR